MGSLCVLGLGPRRLLYTCLLLFGVTAAHPVVVSSSTVAIPSQTSRVIHGGEVGFFEAFINPPEPAPPANQPAAYPASYGQYQQPQQPQPPASQRGGYSGRGRGGSDRGGYHTSSHSGSYNGYAQPSGGLAVLVPALPRPASTSVVGCSSCFRSKLPPGRI